MKRFLILSFIILIWFSLFAIISCSDVFSNNNLYGVWIGEYGGKEYTFKFNSDGSFVLSLKDLSSGVVEILKGEYKADFSKRPIPLTLRSISQLNHPLYTIIEFLDNDSIRMADFTPRWRIRPISFSYHKIIYLNRD